MEPQAAKAVGAVRLSSLLARGRRSRHPPTLHMVLEALQAQDGKKGASVVAIKRFILAKYPAVDPVRLKYLLKRALATGLSRGFLVRPQNSSALGATGRFKLAPKKLQQKQTPGQEDPGEGPAPKLGLKGAAEAARAPAVVQSDGGQGVAKEKPRAVKKPRAKPADAQPAVGKPGSDGVKAHRAPGKAQSQPPSAPAAKGVREDSDDHPAGARVKRPQKTPTAKSKEKVPEEAQEAALKKKGGKSKARKPQAALGAGQGKKARAQEPTSGRKVS